jgi:hypothetical protein
VGVRGSTLLKNRLKLLFMGRYLFLFDLFYSTYAQDAKQDAENQCLGSVPGVTEIRMPLKGWLYEGD